MWKVEEGINLKPKLIKFSTYSTHTLCFHKNLDYSFVLLGCRLFRLDDIVSCLRYFLFHKRINSDLN